MILIRVVQGLELSICVQSDDRVSDKADKESSEEEESEDPIV